MKKSAKKSPNRLDCVPQQSNGVAMQTTKQNKEETAAQMYNRKARECREILARFTKELDNLEKEFKGKEINWADESSIEQLHESIRQGSAHMWGYPEDEE